MPSVLVLCTRYHHGHIASEGRTVTLPWLRDVAWRHRLTGMVVVPRRNWSTQQDRGRPGTRLHSRPSKWLDESPTWHHESWAGTPFVRRTMCPNTDWRRRTMRLVIEGRPVGLETSVGHKIIPTDIENYLLCIRHARTWQRHMAKSARCGSRTLFSVSDSQTKKVKWCWQT